MRAVWPEVKAVASWKDSNLMRDQHTPQRRSKLRCSKSRRSREAVIVVLDWQWYSTSVVALVRVRVCLRAIPAARRIATPNVPSPSTSRCAAKIIFRNVLKCEIQVILWNSHFSLNSLLRFFVRNIFNRPVIDEVVQWHRFRCWLIPRRRWSENPSSKEAEENVEQHGEKEQAEQEVIVP